VEAHKGVLFVIGTPIGNLEDFTPRARRTLNEVSLIVAEDTRRLRALAPVGGFRARLLSVPAPREAERVATVLGHLARGESAALVTDAGTPVVSDPGARLVRAARDAGFEVVPIPGASAVATALAGGGLSGSSFLFLGFLPVNRVERRRLIDEVARSPRTIVLFEAPHRLARTLRELAAACGPDRRGVIARELTKLHEEITSATLGRLLASLPEQVRGEVTLLVEAGDPDRVTSIPSATTSTPSLEAVVERLMRDGSSASRAAREAARQLGRDRREAYRIALSLQEAWEAGDGDQ
jgi:16S rRNA (cytidine1402-2'-O)-methyltransferase